MQARHASLGARRNAQFPVSELPAFETILWPHDSPQLGSAEARTPPISGSRYALIDSLRPKMAESFAEAPQASHLLPPFQTQGYLRGAQNPQETS